jgi:hypothetical protein
MEAILEPLLKAGGVTGLVIGVFYLLYRQVLSMGIFAKLGSAQSVKIFRSRWTIVTVSSR